MHSWPRIFSVVQPRPGQAVGRNPLTILVLVTVWWKRWTTDGLRLDSIANAGLHHEELLTEINRCIPLLNTQCSTCRKAKSELTAPMSFKAKTLPQKHWLAKNCKIDGSFWPTDRSFFNTSGNDYWGTRFERYVDHPTVKEAADLLASDGKAGSSDLYFCQRRKSCSSGLPNLTQTCL